ncbi:MAG TPA: sigma-54 dependent transcriptional regulator [Candidatus Saccharimonadales bacterium]|nr:sigma-54 dependent transcriptional regulator [Candidatus Saccharimonadales bacterium]
MGYILVCDDERSICQMLQIAFQNQGHRVETVTTGEQACRKIDSNLYDIVVTDVRMPHVGGMEVLQHSRRVSPDTLVIVITAVDDSEVPIEALNAGAFYYIRKGPKLLEDVLSAANLAMDRSQLRQQNAALLRDAAQHNSLDNIIGESEPMRKLKQTIRTIATTNSTVIVSGESGTGKELVARAIHTCSPRSGNPFVSVNCGAFPETLLESELFGYVKGAFTGANANKRGLFELSSGGTIFLDEIGETTLSMQVKLLRVLQERCIRPVGGGQETPIDVRVIAATNKNLLQQVQEGQFREDLYYRLSVIPVEVPPLRDRGEDVVLLANHFLKKFAVQMSKNVVRLSAQSLQTMKGYDWPGNVRVLENTIERAVALSTEEELRVELPNSGASAIPTMANNGALGVALPPDGLDLERYIADVEKSLLQSAMRRSNGVQTRAAEILKLSYRSFRHMMKKYDLS